MRETVLTASFVSFFGGFPVVYVFQRPATDDAELLEDVELQPLTSCLVSPAIQRMPAACLKVHVAAVMALVVARTAALKNHWEWKGAQYASRTNTGIGSSRLSHVPDDLLDEEIWEKVVSYIARIWATLLVAR